MLTWRVMATAGARFERLLLTDAAFSLILNHRGLRDVPHLEPDLVVATAADARALAALCLAAPPRVLVTARAGEGALGKGDADGVIPSDCPDDAFLRAARQAAAMLTPALAFRTGAARRAALEGLLDRLGMPRALTGRAYILFAADMLAASPSLCERVTAAVYPAVAERCGTSRFAVERAMRTAIEHVFLRGSMKEITALFGMTVDPERGKPTNSEFLALLAEHARNQLSLRNSESRPGPSPVSATISATASPSARMPR